MANEKDLSELTKALESMEKAIQPSVKALSSMTAAYASHQQAEAQLAASMRTRAAPPHKTTKLLHRSGQPPLSGSHTVGTRCSAYSSTFAAPPLPQNESYRLNVWFGHARTGCTHITDPALSSCTKQQSRSAILANRL